VQAGACIENDLPVGHVTENPVKQKILLLRKHFASVFRKIMALISRPAPKRGERVVTIAGQDAMDANALSDGQCASGRQRRVGLAPSWQVPSLQMMICKRR
jgi:hypothetical protein